MNPTYIDADGNTVRKIADGVEIVAMGPALLAQATATGTAAETQRAKIAANKAALNGLALQCKDFANGTTAMPGTLAGLTQLVKRLCEMNARLWHNETFGDP